MFFVLLVANLRRFPTMPRQYRCRNLNDGCAESRLWETSFTSFTAENDLGSYKSRCTISSVMDARDRTNLPPNRSLHLGRKSTVKSPRQKSLAATVILLDSRKLYDRNAL